MWRKYKNGNYDVYINLENGSKYRITEDDEFTPSMPESMDIKITNNCDVNCAFCHEGSTKDGRHADLSQDFIDSLRPYQEIALGGGNVLTHPNIEDFLQTLKRKKVIPSITVNQSHFIDDFDYIKELYDNQLVYGVGVSLTDSYSRKLIDNLHELPTSVLHVINGMFANADYERLKDESIRLLVLGYKYIRRGVRYKDKMANILMKNQEWLANNLNKVYTGFEIVSFDNLALEQLPVKESVNSDIWNDRYMGDDGNFTFYIDMVSKEFAQSSTSLKRYSIENKTVDEMFQSITMLKQHN